MPSSVWTGTLRKGHLCASCPLQPADVETSVTAVSLCPWELPWPLCAQSLLHGGRMEPGLRCPPFPRSSLALL